ncbi:MAG: hypothetical protein A2X59_06455 [Nitrospirae bacterium GWC2_42_7]|nr:MAG: hypothetical protein A2X59_06455 [Nitrospirae bacterium GWC2_42_7]
MQKGRFYITTTTPYVNADPHIGFALEVITADVIARYHSQLGEEVVFNTGTDEHGLKIYQQAQTEKLTPQQFTDKYSQRFRELKGLLNLGFTNFIRTTEKHHEAAAQEFWRRCDAHGDIYKKLYKIKYCVGCELEKTESELVDGKCPIHPNKILEIIEEENYFFRFSRYQKQLLELYKNNHLFVLPREKYNEIVAFVAGGLQDFSISRVKAKMPWGIPVPGDDAQVMYVWFDALINYISTFIVISADYVMQTFNIFFVLCCFAFGISICSYWITFSMRLQLKLKLRYFQARYMERKMDSAGEFIFSDEAPYFSPLIHKLESPDNKETLLYPSSGALRMDGFAGNAQPRHLSLFMPSVFIVIYLAMTLGVILKLYY